ncbi:MAG TPA: hypothetical protein VF843_09265 [Streptosporangiaceae bacterium]
MIRIPVYLAVAQWALLAALGVLVIVMFRQLGRLMTGRAHAAPLGPAVGSLAPALTYARPGQPDQRRLIPGGGRPALLAFVDPTCPSCEDLVELLGKLDDDGELDGLTVLALISDPPSYLQISEVFKASGLEIGRPVRRSGLDAYRVSATPLLVAIDAAGLVRASGSVVRADEVREFVRSARQPRDVLPVIHAHGGEHGR